MRTHKYNWGALKNEWLKSYEATGETLNKFRIRKGISETSFYRKTAKEKWAEEGQRMKNRITQRIETQLVNEALARWQKEIRITDGIEDQVEFILQELRQNEKVANALEPSHLLALATTIEKCLKTKKLAHGESTGDEPQAQANVHAAIIQVINNFQPGSKPSRPENNGVPEVHTVVDAEIVTEDDIRREDQDNLR